MAEFSDLEWLRRSDRGLFGEGFVLPNTPTIRPPNYDPGILEGFGRGMGFSYSPIPLEASPKRTDVLKRLPTDLKSLGEISRAIALDPKSLSGWLGFFQKNKELNLPGYNKMTDDQMLMEALREAITTQYLSTGSVLNLETKI